MVEGYWLRTIPLVVKAHTDVDDVIATRRSPLPENPTGCRGVGDEIPAGFLLCHTLFVTPRNMSTISQLLRLASEVETLLREAGTYQEYVDRKKKDRETPLSKKEWEARTQGGSESPKLDTSHSKIKDLIDDVMDVDISEDVQNVMKDLERGIPPHKKSLEKMVNTLKSVREDLFDLYDGGEEDPEKDPAFKKKLKNIDDAVKLLKDLPTSEADYRKIDYDRIYRDN